MSDKSFKILTVFIAVILALIVFAVASVFIWLCWNIVISPVLSLPVISVWQGVIVAATIWCIYGMLHIGETRLSYATADEQGKI